MRLHFTLTPNKEPVPFAYQNLLTGVLHKWLGRNSLHDSLSLYSLSWLYDGYKQNDHLEFPQGARWMASFYDDDLAQRVSDKALLQPEVFCGMRVTQITQQETPLFGDRYVFKVGSPVLAKFEEEPKKIVHLTYSSDKANDIITATLRHKIDRAGLGTPHNQVNVYFDTSYRNAKTKIVRIGNIGNKGSICPLIVEGTPEAVRCAWDVGIGHGTGSCFGFLL